MRQTYRQRDARFEVIGKCLVRSVTDLATDRIGERQGYKHRCSRASYEAVAIALDTLEARRDGLTMRQIVEQERLPFTQVNVALEFMLERSIILPIGRGTFRGANPAKADVYLDAMVEFCALAEEPMIG